MPENTDDIKSDCRLVAEKIMGWECDNHIDVWIEAVEQGYVDRDPDRLTRPAGFYMLFNKLRELEHQIVISTDLTGESLTILICSIGLKKSNEHLSGENLGEILVKVAAKMLRKETE